MYFTFSDKPINNIDSKFEDTTEKFNRKPSSPISDQNKTNCTLKVNSYTDRNTCNTEYSDLTKKDSFPSLNKNQKELHYKKYKAQDDVKETDHFNPEENDSALKQIESMMGRNYSDFMRSLASKYNKE